MKICSKCREWKSKEEFRPRSYGLNSSCRLCDAKYSRTWRKKNPDKMRESNKRFREQNPDYGKNQPVEAKERHKHQNTLLRRREEFKARRRETRGKYRQKEAEYTRARRRRLREALVFPWEKQQIKDFYSGCPEGMIVDHIVPLFGNMVSGLHTISNLQYLTAQENSLKSWSFDGTPSNEGWRKIKSPRIGA